LFLLIFLAVATYSPWTEPVAPDLLTATLLGNGNAENVALAEGYPSLAVIEESHASSQEAGGMVMEAFIRRYYCFPLHCFGSSSISLSNLHVFLVLLVMESGRSC
jgi:hypothetical protein